VLWLRRRNPIDSIFSDWAPLCTSEVVLTNVLYMDSRLRHNISSEMCVCIYVVCCCALCSAFEEKSENHSGPMGGGRNAGMGVGGISIMSPEKRLLSEDDKILGKTS